MLAAAAARYGAFNLLDKLSQKLFGHGPDVTLATGMVELSLRHPEGETHCRAKDPDDAAFEMLYTLIQTYGSPVERPIRDLLYQSGRYRC